MSILASSDLGNNVLVVIVDHDPMVVATDAPKGSLIIDTNGDWYRKLDDGATTNVEAMGGLGAVSKAIDHTWEGNGANNRVIDLGDDYDLIFIYLEESRSGSLTHLAHAYAFRNVYGYFYLVNVNRGCNHRSLVTTYFQGKMTGGDINKIRLGSTGNSIYGTNYSGWTYRLVGIKFSSME